MNFKNLIFLLFLTTFGCKQNGPNNAVFEKWGSTNIIRLKDLELASDNEDLAKIKDVVKGVKVVCLGESRHDISEQFLLKNRLIKFLIQDLGFRTFVLEASLPYSNQLNNYLNSGTGNLDQLMAEMPGWFLWDTQELKELLNWIRAFNTQTDDKVSFFGFDIVAPNTAYEQIFDYLKSVDEAKHMELKNFDFGREVINDAHWPTTLAHFANLSEERKSSIRNNVDQLYQTIVNKERNYKEKSSEQAYQWVLKITYSVKEAINMFTAKDRMEMGLIRDEAMANLCSWIIRREGKTIIWAHNVHIAKSEFTMSMFPDQKIKGMGALLADEFQKELISIGGTFGEGEFQNEGRSFPIPADTTMDGKLSKFGMDNFIVDLRLPTNEPDLKKWLSSENTMKGQEFEMFCVPIDAFDALYYTNKVSKAKYNLSTMERMGRSNNE